MGPTPALDATAPSVAGIGQPFVERKWIPLALMLGDVVALEIAFFLSNLLRGLAQRTDANGFATAEVRGVALGLLMVPLANLLAGLYAGYGLSPVQRLRVRLKSAFTIFGALILWAYLNPHGVWPRGLLLGVVPLSLVLPAAAESWLIRFLTFQGYWGTPVLTLGVGASARALAQKLQTQPELGLVPAMVIDGEGWNRAMPAHAAAGIRIAVVAISNERLDRLTALLEDLPFPRVIVVPDIAGLQTQWITALDLGGTLGLEMRRDLLLRSSKWLKRAVDFLVAVPLLIVTAPLMALCALCVKRTSPGPAFHAQNREGYGGKTIRVWKLRTMHLEADRMLDECLERDSQSRDEWAASFKLRHDPRVLPGIGNLLRRSSLDELPQLWNVLRGEMSLVGPRPFPFYHLEHFDRDFCRLRRQVLPGLTGLWQISARGSGDLRLQESLDTYYIRNWSLWLDIHILSRTLGAVLKGKGAY